MINNKHLLSNGGKAGGGGGGERGDEEVFLAILISFSDFLIFDCLLRRRFDSAALSSPVYIRLPERRQVIEPN